MSSVSGTVTVGRAEWEALERRLDALTAERDALVVAVLDFLSNPGIAGRRQRLDEALAAVEPPEEQP